jgi:hypothetical protein
MCRGLQGQSLRQAYIILAFDDYREYKFHTLMVNHEKRSLLHIQGKADEKKGKMPRYRH